MAKRQCSVEDCERFRHAQTFCHKHYEQWRSNGDPLRNRRYDTSPLEARFWPKVNKTDSCWLWTGAKTGAGYGMIREVGHGGKMLMAHRVAYELLVGPIPEGLFLDHLCRTPLCVNPAHLEPVTCRENMRRGLLGVLKMGRIK